MTVRFTTAEAASKLGIDESLIRRYCRQGKLGERIGRNFSITESQLQKFSALPRKVGRKPTTKASSKWPVKHGKISTQSPTPANTSTAGF